MWCYGTVYFIQVVNTLAVLARSAYRVKWMFLFGQNTIIPRTTVRLPACRMDSVMQVYMIGRASASALVRHHVLRGL